MKVTKSDLKNIIKECLTEMISDGSLNSAISAVITEQVAMQNPAIRSAAMAAGGGNPQQTSIMGQIFADTAMNHGNDEAVAMSRLSNTMAIQQQMAFPPAQQQVMMGMPQQQMLMQEGMPGFGLSMPRNQLPPADPNAMAQFQAQQNMAVQHHQQQQSPFVSNWARLAFNSPISNRPKSGAAGGSGGFLPGQRTGGQFGNL